MNRLLGRLIILFIITSCNKYDFKGSPETIDLNPPPNFFTAVADPTLTTTMSTIAQGTVVRLSPTKMISVSTSIYVTNDDGVTWSVAAANLLSHRSGFTVTELDNGLIWIHGGSKTSVVCDISTEFLNPNTLTLSPGPNLTASRNNFASRKLSDGRVIMVGGNVCPATGGGSAVVEITTVNATSVSATGSLNLYRENFAMGELQDGRVIVAGGMNSDNWQSHTEIYNPGTQTWAVVASMNSDRGYISGAGVVLQDGRFMVIGGYRSHTWRSNSQIYDPGGNTWKTVNMPFGATTFNSPLTDGRVVVWGGYNQFLGGALRKTAIFTPSTDPILLPGDDVWTALPDLVLTNFGGFTFTQSDGKIGFASSNPFGTESRLTVFNPADNTFTFKGNFESSYGSGIASTFHSNGKIYLFGGVNLTGPLDLVRVLDPIAENFLSTFHNISARQHISSIELSDGLILLAGGHNGASASLTTTQIYDPGDDSVRAVGAMSVARHLGQALKLSDNRIIQIGGYTNSTVLSSIDLFDPDPETWALGNPMSVARAGHAAYPLSGNRILVIGGSNAGGTLSSTEIYDVALGTWSAGPSMGTARHSFASVQLPDGKIVVAGGDNAGTVLSTTEVYDPIANSWNAGPSLILPRKNGQLVYHNSGFTLFAGSNLTDSALVSSEVFGLGSSISTIGPLMRTPRSSGYTWGKDAESKVWVIGGLQKNGVLTGEFEYLKLQ